MRNYKILRNMKKWLRITILFFSFGIIIVSICYTFLLYLSDWWFPEFNGSYSLGNNIYMLDWDGGGRIIVRGTSTKGNTCYGGERLIPTYENQYDTKGNIVEYVVDAMSDDNWVIVKTDKKNTLQRKYYIMDKRKISDKMSSEEIIEEGIECFADSIEFSKVCLKNRIKIQW